MYSFNHIHTIHLSVAIRRSLSLHFLIACILSGETPPCGAEPRIKLGPALQQADALPTEPHRTIIFIFIRNTDRKLFNISKSKIEVWHDIFVYK